MKSLRILAGKNHRKMKLQRLQKVQIWAFGFWVVGTTNHLFRFLNRHKIFKKNKVVTGKTLFFVIGPFCSHHFTCLNIGFWYDSFEWKWYFFNLSAFNEKTVLQFFEKGFRFPENLFQTFNVFTDCHIKTCRYLKPSAILKIPSAVF